MTDSVIAPVSFPSMAARDRRSPNTRSGGQFPVPVIPMPRLGSAVYGLAAVDCRGRIADRPVFAALGWLPGTRLSITVTHATLLIRFDSSGVFAMTRQGHLRLPAPVRRRCSLAPGDRVLLAAQAERGALLVHPPAVLDRMLTDRHAMVLDGDRP